MDQVSGARSKNIPISLAILFNPIEATRRIKEKNDFWFPFIIISSIISIMYAFQITGLALSQYPISVGALIGAFLAFCLWVIIMLLASAAIIISITFLIWLSIRWFKENISFSILLAFSCYQYMILGPLSMIISGFNPNGFWITGLAYWIPASGLLANFLNHIELFYIWQVVMEFFFLRELVTSNQKVIGIVSLHTIIYLLIGTLTGW